MAFNLQSNEETHEKNLEYFQNAMEDLKKIYSKMHAWENEHKSEPDFSEANKLNEELLKSESISAKFIELFKKLSQSTESKLEVKAGDKDLVANIMDKIEREKGYAEDRWKMVQEDVSSYGIETHALALSINQLNKNIKQYKIKHKKILQQKMNVMRNKENHIMDLHNHLSLIKNAKKNKKKSAFCLEMRLYTIDKNIKELLSKLNSFNFIFEQKSLELAKITSQKQENEQKLKNLLQKIKDEQIKSEKALENLENISRVIGNVSFSIGINNDLIKRTEDLTEAKNQLENVLRQVSISELDLKTICKKKLNFGLSEMCKLCVLGKFWKLLKVGVRVSKYCKLLKIDCKKQLEEYTLETNEKTNETINNLSNIIKKKSSPSPSKISEPLPIKKISPKVSSAKKVLKKKKPSKETKESTGQKEIDPEKPQKPLNFSSSTKTTTDINRKYRGDDFESTYFH